MAYQEALEAAGAEVILFKEFGSYQGDWWAKVRFNGEVGWIEGSYGSCSYCDAFEAEFDWQASEKSDYQERLAEFGRGYLHNIMSQDEAEKQTLAKASREYAWDDDREIAVFIAASRSA